MKETLSIRHGEMLVEVLGMEIGEIWQKLIDFVLWGEPDPDKDLRGWRLFWAWKAIVMLQGWEKDLVGWALPDQITSNILGWDYKKVLDSLPKSDQLAVTYSQDTWLAYTIYGIVVAFVKQSDVPHMEDVYSKPALEPGRWYWNIVSDCPAFLRCCVDGSARVLMPTVHMDDGPVADDDYFPLYTLTSFNDVVVDYGELRRVNLESEELPY